MRQRSILWFLTLCAALATAPMVSPARAATPEAGTTGRLEPAPVPGGPLPRVGASRGLGQANPGGTASEQSGPTYSTPFSGAPSPSQSVAGAASPPSTVEVPGARAPVQR